MKLMFLKKIIYYVRKIWLVGMNERWNDDLMNISGVFNNTYKGIKTRLYLIALYKSGAKINYE